VPPKESETPPRESKKAKKASSSPASAVVFRLRERDSHFTVDADKDCACLFAGDLGDVSRAMHWWNLKMSDVLDGTTRTDLDGGRETRFK
jgi:hypothetical protein